MISKINGFGGASMPFVTPNKHVLGFDISASADDSPRKHVALLHAAAGWMAPIHHRMPVSWALLLSLSFSSDKSISPYTYPAFELRRVLGEARALADKRRASLSGDRQDEADEVFERISNIEDMYEEQWSDLVGEAGRG